MAILVLDEPNGSPIAMQGQNLKKIYKDHVSLSATKLPVWTLQETLKGAKKFISLMRKK